MLLTSFELQDGRPTQVLHVISSLQDHIVSKEDTDLPSICVCNGYTCQQSQRNTRLECAADCSPFSTRTVASLPVARNIRSPVVASVIVHFFCINLSSEPN